MKKISIEYTRRQVIPRWLPFSSHQMANQAEDYVINVHPSDKDMQSFYKLVQDWKENKTITYAIQVIAAADTFGLFDSQDYKDAVHYVKNSTSPLKNNQLILDFISIDGLNKINTHDSKNIKETKSKLLANDRDPLLWLDLAYFYSLIGKKDKAEKYIKIALSLNNYNPYIIRSAARFYLLKEDPEQALNILRKSPNIKVSPLILSTEIAISELCDMKSRLKKTGKDLALSSNFKPHIISELNATIATLEQSHGNIKKSKHYVSNALFLPNENTLAQIQFLYRQRNIDFSIDKYDIPYKFEVDMWNNYFSNKYPETLAEADRLYKFHPFSARPIILSSFIQASLFDKDEEALRMINNALKIIPPSTTLLNNKAFSLARIGKIEEARSCMDKIKKEMASDSDSGDSATLKATKGLIEYKSNNPTLGRELYKESASFFSRNQDHIREARAAFFWYIEEKKHDPVLANKILTRVKELTDNFKIEETKFLLKKNKLI